MPGGLRIRGMGPADSLTTRIFGAKKIHGYSAVQSKFFSLFCGSFRGIALFLVLRKNPAAATLAALAAHPDGPGSDKTEEVGGFGALSESCGDDKVDDLLTSFRRSARHRTLIHFALRPARIILLEFRSRRVMLIVVAVVAGRCKLFFARHPAWGPGL